MTMTKSATILSVLLLAVALLSGCQTAKEDSRPNIVLIMADDMGFSDIGCYGGEVQTPNLDKLAKGGLRYTQFYNNARCCPTRASLITGLYPHQAGMGWMTAADLGTPEYQGELNEQCVTIAEVLKEAGYSTYMSGKWHLSRGRNIRAGIKTNWPKQRGYDRYFGIIDGASNYFNPVVFSDNESYPAPGEDFYFTHAVSDSSVMFIDQHLRKKKDEPFFLYVAYTSPHWPLHALKRDIDKYKDIYKTGWDNLRERRFAKQVELGIFKETVGLTPRDEKVPAWDDLAPEKQDEFAMRMAIYAAQIDAMDQGIGRIVNKLKEEKQLDNTLIFFLSDNGACAEFISSGESKELTGEANTWESYRIHWANASSTPYKEYKHWIHEGGIATPLIVHWPSGIKGSNRFVREPGHIVDIMSTCVDVAKAEYPSVYKGNQIHPMEGQSLTPHFRGEPNNRKLIFWEHEANIGVRDGRWKLVAKTPENAKFDTASLELYDMERDPTEMTNLAQANPEKLQELFAAWQAWARKVGVHMDTREYNHRAREYQRKINGEFDEMHAGWNFVGGDNGYDFSIDTTGQISSKYSAKITAGPNAKQSCSLRWPFQAMKGEAFDLGAKVRGNGEASVKIVWIQPQPVKNIATKPVKPGTEAVEIQLLNAAAQRDGRCVLSIEIEGLKPGESVWIDAVSLLPKKSS